MVNTVRNLLRTQSVAGRPQSLYGIPKRPTAKSKRGSTAIELSLCYPHNSGPGGCCGFYQPSYELVNSYQVDANGSQPCVRLSLAIYVFLRHEHTTVNRVTYPVRSRQTNGLPYLNGEYRAKPSVTNKDEDKVSVNDNSIAVDPRCSLAP